MTATKTTSKKTAQQLLMTSTLPVAAGVAPGTLRNAAGTIGGTLKSSKIPEITMQFAPLYADATLLASASRAVIEFEPTTNDEQPSAINVDSDVKPIAEPANGLLFKEFNSEVCLSVFLCVLCCFCFSVCCLQFFFCLS